MISLSSMHVRVFLYKWTFLCVFFFFLFYYYSSNPPPQLFTLLYYIYTYIYLIPYILYPLSLVLILFIYSPCWPLHDHSYIYWKSLSKRFLWSLATRELASAQYLFSSLSLSFFLLILVVSTNMACLFLCID